MEVSKFWTKTKVITILVILFIIGLIVGGVYLYRTNMAKKYKELEANNVSNKYEYSRKYEQLVLRLYNQEIITTSRFNELMKGRYNYSF